MVDQLRSLAEALIFDAIEDIEYLTVFETAEGYFDRELTEDEAYDVLDLVHSKAAVQVSWL